MRFNQEDTWNCVWAEISEREGIYITINGKSFRDEIHQAKKIVITLGKSSRKRYSYFEGNPRKISFDKSETFTARVRQEHQAEHIFSFGRILKRMLGKDPESDSRLRSPYPTALLFVLQSSGRIGRGRPDSLKTHGSQGHHHG
jgi:hypothetical protein